MRKYPELIGKPFLDNQELYKNKYQEVLADYLRDKGIEPTKDRINQSWVVGAGGLSEISKANPNALLDEILGPDVVAINPNLKGKTAARFLQDPNPYSKASDPISTKAEPRVTSIRVGQTTPAPGFNTIEGQTRGVYGTAAQQNKRQVLGGPERKEPIAPLTSANGSSAGVLQEAARVQGRETFNAPALPVPKPLDVSELPKDIQQEFRAFDNKTLELLNDQNVQEDIRSLEIRYNEYNGKDKQPWLVEQLKGLFSKLYGDSGFFKQDDLIRFAILTAGGLATGGSVGGSIRYAGLDVLKNRDARVAGESAANAKRLEQLRATQAEAFKNDRESSESYVGKTMQLYSDLAPEHIREVSEMVAKANALRDAGKVAEANQLARHAYGVASALKQDKANAPKPSAPTQAYMGSRAVNIRMNGDRQEYLDPKDNMWKPTAKPLLPIDVVNKNSDEIGQSVVARLTPVIRETKFKSDRDGAQNAEREARAIADIAKFDYKYNHGDIDPVTYGGMADAVYQRIATAGAQPTQESFVRQMAFQRVFAGTNNAALYMKDNKLPPMSFLNDLGGKISQIQKAKPEMTMQQIEQTLHNMYLQDKANPKMKGAIDYVAKTNNVSDFVAWVQASGLVQKQN